MWLLWIRENHAFLQQNSQTCKQIEVDISIFLCYSVLYRHVVKHCFVFVAASIFNPWFYVRLFLGLWLNVDCAASSHKVMADYVELAGHIENGIFMIPGMDTWSFFSSFTHTPTKLCHYRQIRAFYTLYSYSMSTTPGQQKESVLN